MKKSCSKCKEVKLSTSFFPDSRNRSGLSSECRSCRILMTRRWKAQRGEEYLKEQAFKRRQHSFGIAAAEYWAMHETQGGLCAVCQKPEVRKHQSGKIKTLAIDHDHSTGIIRELLCGRCNNALGQFDDNPELLDKAANYLRKHAANPSGKVIPFRKAA